jgi:hypothetical protein
MPITPIHIVGPGLLQKAVAPKATDLWLYGAASFAIDAEPIIKGISSYTPWPIGGSLHTWTHEPGWMLAIALACGVAWRVCGLCSRWTAFWTATGAALTHYVLDWIMHSDIRGTSRPFDIYGADLAHGMAAWCFLIGAAILSVRHRKQIVAWLRRELRLESKQARP